MNLQDGITLGEALTITAFSMLLVFTTLIVISFLLSAFKLLGNRKEKKPNKEAIAIGVIGEVDGPTAEFVTEKSTEQEDDLELIAVITASIAATLSKPMNSIVVRNIVRIPQSTPVWGSVSRQEIINK